jgi:cell division protein FtsI/penicillin-binding protein 2
MRLRRDPLSDPSRHGRRPTWREYQDRLRPRRRTPRGRRWFGIAGGLVLAAAALYGIVGAIATPPASAPATETADRRPAGADPETALLSKTDVQDLLFGVPASRLVQEHFQVRFGERLLDVTTTIDPDLQAALTDALDTRHARYIAVVVLNAANGRILAMVGFDRTDPDANPCLDKHFPAASIFKIVTAAAAVEKLGMTAGTPLTYNGARHTLYKSQIKDTRNRWTRKTTLQESFALSVNPVFGKLGALYLKHDDILRFGEAFGFNQSIRLEVPVEPSLLEVDAEPYHWAEVASGFNRQTMISPLHGALLAASLVNAGTMMEPSVVRSVRDAQGRVLYESTSAPMHRPVSPETTEVLRRLMAATVARGTARKPFRGYQKDKVLARLDIGGKTGSIDNQTHDARLDWFVGYAGDGQDKIALGAIVAHEDYIGKRAATYARNAISAYFQTRSGS